MKKVTMVLAMVFALCAGPAFAADLRVAAMFDRVVVEGGQGALISIQMEEPAAEPAAPATEPAKPKREKKAGDPNWGGGGGALLQYVSLDLSPLDPMTDDRGLDAFDDQMLLIGGMGGLIYKDFRFGGFGFGNSQDVADRDPLGERISAEMTFGGGGVYLEANHAVTPQFGVLIGSLVGAGAISLEATGPDLGPDKEWDADSSFFMALPYAGLWYAPTRWMWVQLDCGYLFFDMDASSSEFENDLGVEMVDDDLTGGLAASLKINFGWLPGE